MASSRRGYTVRRRRDRCRDRCGDGSRSSRYGRLCFVWLAARAAKPSFKRPLLSVEVSVYLCVGNFDAKYLEN